MTLLDLRKAFGYGMEIYLKNDNDWFLITNILWGTPSFFGMTVHDDSIKISILKSIRLDFLVKMCYN